MARRKTPDDSPVITADNSVPGDTALPLEQAMAELAEIASRLESGQESLDQSLARFERGMQLLRICHQQLDQAAQRIEIVTRIGASGPPETEPFDARATFQKEQTRTARTSSDDAGDVLF
ncbi:MAG: Exodeoxyribonuclease 7 small subunit [Planctomycetota bacterium]|jgi:exodeoxyribonuclease VII small subunit